MSEFRLFENEGKNRWNLDAPAAVYRLRHVAEPIVQSEGYKICFGRDDQVPERGGGCVQGSERCRGDAGGEAFHGGCDEYDFEGD